MLSEKPLLVDTGKGFTIKYQEKFLYSSLDPIRAVKKQITGLALADATVYLIPSLGLGYGIPELLERLPASSLILCVEKDPLLMQLAIAQQVVPIPSHIQLVILRADEPRQACQLLYKQGIWRFRRLQVLQLCAGCRLYPDFYSDLERALADEIRLYWQNKMTVIHMGKLWIKNVFANLPLMAAAHSLNELKLTAPVVVAGAGPSLEENLAELKKFRSRFFLLAVDTALPVLGDSGLKPDLIFMLESQFANIYDFMAYPVFDLPLICDLSGAPQIIRLFKNKIFFFATRFYPLGLLERLEQAGLVCDWFPPLGSVGVAAVEAALRMTTGPVIFTGLDFSYPGKKIHAAGAPFHRLMLAGQQRLAPAENMHFSALARRPLLSVKGKDGQTVLTDLVLSAYGERLAEVVRQCPERLYDLGRQGLLTGAQALRLSQAQDSFLTREWVPDQLLPVAGGSALDCSAKKSSVANKCIKMTDFFTGEKALLTSGLEFLQSRSGGDAKTRQELQPAEAELLQKLDYLYFYFPDKAPLHELNPTFFARLQLEAGRTLNTLFK